jgi:hypothetical protein
LIVAQGWAGDICGKMDKAAAAARKVGHCLAIRSPRAAVCLRIRV